MSRFGTDALTPEASENSRSVHGSVTENSVTPEMSLRSVVTVSRMASPTAPLPPERSRNGITATVGPAACALVKSRHNARQILISPKPITFDRRGASR